MRLKDAMHATAEWQDIYNRAQAALGAERDHARMEAFATQILRLGRLLEDPLPQEPDALMHALRQIRHSVECLLKTDDESSCS